MSKVRVEVFLSLPRCAGGVRARRLLDRLRDEFGEAVEIITHVGRCAEMERHAINLAPALVVGGLIKFVGVVPTYGDLVGAVRKAGLE